MIHHVWSVFCTSSAIDRDSNQVSLFDVVEEIHGEIAGFPGGEKVAIPARFQLVTLWARGDADEAESGLTRVRLVAPNGGDLIKSENEVDLREHAFRRVRLNLAGMPFVGNGRYRFLIELNVEGKWEMIANIPVRIEVKVATLSEKAGPVPRTEPASSP